MTPNKQNVRTKQCVGCPWRLEVDPADIPNGFDYEAYERMLEASERRSRRLAPDLAMQCHDSPAEHPQFCVGWLQHQLGDGNDLALRFRAINGDFADVKWPDPATQRKSMAELRPCQKTEGD